MPLNFIVKPAILAIWLISFLGLCFVGFKRVHEYSTETNKIGEINTWGLADPLYRSLTSTLNSDQAASGQQQLDQVFAANNPLDPNAWLIRSRSLGDQQPLKTALLSQSAKLAWNRPVPLKKIYIDQLLEGDTASAASTAARLLALRPDTASIYFFDLYALLDSDEFYTSILLPAHKDPDQLNAEALLTQFLKSAINAQDKLLIDKIWKLFELKPEFEDDRFKQYTGYLINQHDWKTLQEVWSSASSQDVALSSFADPEFDFVSENGLCWKLTPVDGVSRTDNPNGIQLSFDGNHNLNYQQLSCIVGVEPGSQYRVEYNWSGNKISTRSGMYVEATARIDENIINLGRSDDRAGSWSLQSDQFEFTTPTGAQIITITIRRNPTSNLDNKLSGKVYFTGFKLERLP